MRKALETIGEERFFALPGWIIKMIRDTPHLEVKTKMVEKLAEMLEENKNEHRE